MLDEAQARRRLRSMVASDVEPLLTPEEIEDLLDQARRADRYGVAPDDDGWTETWDLDYAAAEGWSWKAGKLSASYNATVDGAVFNRDQMYQHCRDREEHYRRRCNGSISLAGDEDAVSVAANG